MITTVADLTWEYVCDIHDPDETWYSLLYKLPVVV